MFDSSYVKGYTVPYCQIWISSRSGKPKLLGDSQAATGIFRKNDPSEESFTSVTIKMEAKKPNEASINLLDNKGVLDAGIQSGVECFIKLGYISDFLMTGNYGKKTSKIMMVGVLQSPSVSYNADGTVAITINIRDKTDKLRYEPKTVSFTNMTRQAIINKVLAKYNGSTLKGITINFKEMSKKETKIDQVRMTDLEFMYFLAAKWGATFDTRIDDSTNGMKAFFVDDSVEGDHKIGLSNPSLNGQTVYKMEWRSGLSNVKTLKFTSETSAKTEGGGMLKEGSDGKIVEAKREQTGISDPDDPLNWKLNQSKVEKWLTEHPGATMQDFRDLAFVTPLPELHKMFYDKQVVPLLTTPTSPDSQNPGLGATGFKCDFELSRGDIFLEPNMPVKIDGDVYDRFKSKELAQGFAVKKLDTGKVFEVKKGSILYWRTVTVEHSFSSSGYSTRGTLKR